MPQGTDDLALVVKLASDYGPFLFAILFTLVVPPLAYRNLHDLLTSFPRPNRSQVTLIRHNAVYFRSAWIAGLVLIAFSVVWWLYFHWDEQIHADDKYWISYEGDIYGVLADDMLESPIGSRVYMWTETAPNFHYRFLILNHSAVSSVQPFPVLWFSKRRTNGQDPGG